MAGRPLQMREMQHVVLNEPFNTGRIAMRLARLNRNPARLSLDSGDGDISKGQAIVKAARDAGL